MKPSECAPCPNCHQPMYRGAKLCYQCFRTAQKEKAAANTQQRLANRRRRNKRARLRKKARSIIQRILAGEKLILSFKKLKQPQP